MKLSIWWTIGAAILLGAIGWFVGKKMQRAKDILIANKSASGADAGAAIAAGK